MEQHVIELVDLTKKYGSFTAVDHLSLSVPRGEIFGLLGPNGAGKSTTILMMLGLTEPASGSVKVCGMDSTTNPVEVKRRVGYLPEDVGFYDDRSGLENLQYTAGLNGIGGKEAGEKAEIALGKVGLQEQGAKKTGKYSRGMRQRLGLADVLIKDPEVIILDEPTLGLDPGGVQELLELIVRLSREEGLTVLLSSHHLHQVQQVCDRVGLFVGGKLIAEGTIQQLSQELFSGAVAFLDVAALFEARPFLEAAPLFGAMPFSGAPFVLGEVFEGTDMLIRPRGIAPSDGLGPWVWEEPRFPECHCRRRWNTSIRVDNGVLTGNTVEHLLMLSTGFFAINLLIFIPVSKITLVFGN